MKIEQIEPPKAFKPIVLTIENPAELLAVKKVFGASRREKFTGNEFNDIIVPINDNLASLCLKLGINYYQ